VAGRLLGWASACIGTRHSKTAVTVLIDGAGMGREPSISAQHTGAPAPGESTQTAARPFRRSLRIHLIRGSGVYVPAADLQLLPVPL
jgi:hypothetical protein